MARWSPEVAEARWLDGPVAQGSRFEARNRRGDMEWTVTCHVLAAQPHTRFAWCASDPACPSSIWFYQLTPVATGTKVTQRFQYGPGSSMIRHMIAKDDADIDQIIQWQTGKLAANMAAVLARSAETLGSCFVGSSGRSSRRGPPV